MHTLSRSGTFRCNAHARQELMRTLSIRIFLMRMLSISVKIPNWKGPFKTCWTSLYFSPKLIYLERLYGIKIMKIRAIENVTLEPLGFLSFAISRVASPSGIGNPQKKELFHVKGKCNTTLMLNSLEGLVATRSFSSKRYPVPFCSMQKGISYHTQNLKNLFFLGFSPIFHVLGCNFSNSVQRFNVVFSCV